MVVRNKATGQKITTSTHEWETNIVAKGNDHKYEIIEDGKPIELKKLRVELIEKKTKKK
jgi:hypothetical protein